MALIYQSTSNIGVFGYLPEVSTTIKSLVSGASGVECFDLGDNWRLIDHLEVTLVNGSDGTTTLVNCSFADDPSVLVIGNVDTGSGNALGLRAGIQYNGNSRVSSSAGLSGVGFAVKVTARYFRVRVANTTGVTQRANFYADIKGYGLTP